MRCPCQLRLLIEHLVTLGQSRKPDPERFQKEVAILISVEMLGSRTSFSFSANFCNNASLVAAAVQEPNSLRLSTFRNHRTARPSTTDFRRERKAQQLHCPKQLIHVQEVTEETEGLFKLESRLGRKHGQHIA